jgi:hypothetical protein
LPLAVRIFAGDLLKAVAVDAGFHGEGAAEAPLVVRDRQDQHFFGVAHGLEAVVKVLEEDEELFGILVEQDVFVGAQAVDEAVAAGSGFAFGGARAGRFSGVLTVSVDLGLGGDARFVRVARIFHVVSSGRVALSSPRC